MELDSCIPPGFRFHPTEEELVGYYLTRKVHHKLSTDLEIITDIDLYRIEPWDLQVKCKVGEGKQSEFFFFSHKDKKYPTGTRTNRATAAGFWKATGRDKAVLSKEKMIGMRKTLVFYIGRAPNGKKTDWIIHEYRLQTSEHAPPQEEGWVVCKAFKKQSPANERRSIENCDSVAYYLGQDQDYCVSQTVGVDDCFFTEVLGSHHLAYTYNNNNSRHVVSNEDQIKEPSPIFELSTDPYNTQTCSSSLNPTSLFPIDYFKLPIDEENEWNILDDLL